MEGTAIEYAMEIILKKEMRAEEKRCQRRLQVYTRIFLTVAVILLLGLSAKNLMLIQAMAKESISSLQETENPNTRFLGNEADKLQIRFPNGDLAAVPAISQPYYASILIENGDSLWSIASRYASMTHMDVREYVEELKRINRLTTDRIHAGHYLMVAYYK